MHIKPERIHFCNLQHIHADILRNSPTGRISAKYFTCKLNSKILIFIKIACDVDDVIHDVNKAGKVADEEVVKLNSEHKVTILLENVTINIRNDWLFSWTQVLR